MWHISLYHSTKHIDETVHGLDFDIPSDYNTCPTHLPKTFDYIITNPNIKGSSMSPLA